MTHLQFVEGLCEIIEQQARLIQRLVFELEHANGVSEAARQMAEDIENKKLSILE